MLDPDDLQPGMVIDWHREGKFPIPFKVVGEPDGERVSLTYLSGLRPYPNGRPHLAIMGLIPYPSGRWDPTNWVTAASIEAVEGTDGG